MEEEKDARKGCKIEICKAFAEPKSSGDVVCSFTKTWPRDAITSRVTGGSYVWGYGHTKCAFAVSLDRAEVAKTRKGDATTFSMKEHFVTCDVDDKDPAKGLSFKMKVSITPQLSFDKGKVTAVALDPIKAEGSAAASAVVSSVMAVDKLSGIVSKTLTKEFNDFLTDGCKEEGVVIAQ